MARFRSKDDDVCFDFDQSASSSALGFPLGDAESIQGQGNIVLLWDMLKVSFGNYL